jgi:translocation and assembly module TamB
LKAAVKVLALLTLLLLVLLTLAPFTSAGTRFLLRQLPILVPVEIEYGGGSLLGDLQLASVRVELDSLDLKLLGVESKLSIGCFWRSEICFEHLQVERVRVLIPRSTGSTPGPDSTQESGADQFEFPFAVDSPQLDIALLEVDWDGGGWRSTGTRASFAISGSRIDVRTLNAQQSALTLLSQGEESNAGEALPMPELRLPVELHVGEANLQSADLVLAGQVYAIDKLELSGSWQREELRITRSRLDSKALGTLAVQGSVNFAGDWPLSLVADMRIAEPPIWPYLHNRSFELQFGGDLQEMLVQGGSSGEQNIEVDGAVNVLDPQLPYSVSLESHWLGSLSSSALPGLPEWLPDFSLESPLLLESSGDLGEQELQVNSILTGLGYVDTQLSLSAQRLGESITLEEFTLADSRVGEFLSAQGDLDFGGEALTVNLALASSGLQLPDNSRDIEGTIRGQLSLSTHIENESWRARLSEVELQGEINELPAFLSGDIDLSSSVLITSGNLVGEVNGARIKLASARDSGGAGRLELYLDELSLWQSDLQGKVQFFADISADQEMLRFNSQVEGFNGWGVSAVRSSLLGECQLSENMPCTVQLIASDSRVLEYGIDRIDLQLTGDRVTQRAVLTTSGDINGELKLAGKVVGDQWQGLLSPGSITTPFGAWQLEHEVKLSSNGTDNLEVAAHCWATNDSRLCSDQDLLIGPTGEIDLSLNGGMGFLTSFFVAGMDASGDISAELDVSWSPTKSIEFVLAAHSENGQLTRRYSEDASATLSWRSAKLKLLQDGVSDSLQIQASLDREDGGSLKVDLRLPADRKAALSGDMSVQAFQLAPLAPLLPSVAEIGGTINGAFSLGGSRDSPELVGTARLLDGHLAAVGNPTTVDSLSIEIELVGDSARISGTGLAGGGEFELDGGLTLQPEFEVQLALKGGSHQLLLPPASEAEITQDLKILFRKGLVDISGDIIVHEGRLAPDQLPEGVVGLSSDVVEVNYAGEVIDDKREFDSRLDVRISIRDTFQLSATEFEARLGGDLRLLQDVGKPLQLFGNLQVAGGEVRAYGQRIQIKQGTVAFSGDPDNPDLNLRAERDISLEQIRVGVTVQGTAESPELEIYSNPALPQAEALSYLIRGRGLDTGAGADGTALALSLGTSVVNRSSVLSGINKLPGISNVEFGSTGSADDTAATVGGYIGKRIYLSYGVGLYEPINVLTARFFLQSRLWVEVVSRLENSIDIYYSFDIK